jgi:hypothetical protein
VESQANPRRTTQAAGARFPDRLSLIIVRWKDHAGVLLNEVLNETPENRSSREHCRLTVNSTIAMAVKKRHSKIPLA